MSEQKGRYEDEIRRLLEGMDTFIPEEPGHSRARRRARSTFERASDQLKARLSGIGRPFSGIRRRLAGLRSPSQMILLSYLLVLVGILIRALPALGFIGSLIGLAGVILFFVGYVMSFFGFGRPSYEPRWRGRVIQMPRRRSRLQVWLDRLFGRRW